MYNSFFWNESYSFTIPSDITVPVTNNIAEFNDVEVYEGTRISQNFTVNSYQSKSKIILDNAGIDTSQLLLQ
jgi:ribosomal protein S13